MREELAGMPVAKAVNHAAAFQPGDVTDPGQGARWVLVRPARRIQHLDTEITESTPLSVSWSLPPRQDGRC